MKLYYFTLALSAAMMFFTLSCIKNKVDDLGEKLRILDKKNDVLKGKIKSIEKKYLADDSKLFKGILEDSKNIRENLNALKKDQDHRNSSVFYWGGDNLRLIWIYYKMPKEVRDCVDRLREIFK